MIYTISNSHYKIGDNLSYIGNTIIIDVIKFSISCTTNIPYWIYSGYPFNIRKDKQRKYNN